jgi:hypothetical protein
MNRTARFAFALCFGCTSGPINATTLWLSPGVTETQLVLIDHEPPPF